jgi:hypothetical protein
MLPLADDVPGRRFPVVNVALIVTNCSLWIFWELSHPGSTASYAFYPCAVAGQCLQPQP